MRLFMFVCLFVVLMPLTVLAQTKIVAQVNEDIISDLDFQQRLGFVDITGQADIKDKEVQDQVLRMLIDEKLKQQAAKEAGVAVTDEELNHAVRATLEQNNLSYDEVAKSLKKKNLPLSVMEDQIKTDLMFVRAIRKVAGIRAEVSESEIDARMTEMEGIMQEKQYLISEIILLISEPSEEGAVYGQAMRLIMRMRNGEQFEELAQKFSMAPSASKGGLYGWIAESSLSEEMKEELTLLQPGMISSPILEDGEYKIILLRSIRSPEDMEKREALRLAQLFIPAKLQAKERTSILQDVKMTKGSCEQFIKLSEQIKTTPRVNIGQVLESDLPAPIAALLKKTGLLQPTEPLKIDEGELVFMACAREEASPLPSREMVKAQLESRKLEAMAQRRLRDLRRTAITEIRQ